MAPNHLRGVAITGRMPHEYDSMLTPEAISFVAHLARMYTPRVTELLNRYGSLPGPDIAFCLSSLRQTIALLPALYNTCCVQHMQAYPSMMRLAHLYTAPASQKV